MRTEPTRASRWAGAQGRGISYAKTARCVDAWAQWVTDRPCRVPLLLGSSDRAALHGKSKKDWRARRQKRRQGQRRLREDDAQCSVTIRHHAPCLQSLPNLGYHRIIMSRLETTAAHAYGFPRVRAPAGRRRRRRRRVPDAKLWRAGRFLGPPRPRWRTDPAPVCSCVQPLCAQRMCPR